MLQGGWQALNCISIHATYCVMLQGRLQEKQKCGLRYVETVSHGFPALAGLLVNFRFMKTVLKLFSAYMWQQKTNAADAFF